MMSRLATIPVVDLVRHYDRSWLRIDLLAALTVWALLVPQALANAQLAGVDAVVGLYAAVGAILGYVLMGGVRELSVGPEGTIALLSASAVGAMAAGDSTRHLALLGTLALLVGILLVLGGVARLGFVTRYLSRPLLAGYVIGAGIVMIVSQLDTLLGITLVTVDDTVGELLEIVRRIGETDPLTLAVGLSVMAIVLLVRRVSRRLPAYLIAVLAAIVASVAFELASRGVAVVGDIEPGLPPIGLPPIAPGDVATLIGPALGIALLIYADSGVTGQILAHRGRYRVNADREFFGLGLANVGAALTGGFPVQGSQSRSFTAADAKARSQMAQIGVLALVLVTLVALTPLFEPLPKSALAGVIIIVAFGLIDVGEMRRLYRLDRADAGLAVLAVVVVVWLGLLAGVMSVVLVSLLLVVQRATVPRTATLVRVPGTSTYRSAEETPDGETIPGLLIYRFDAPLFFANAGQLHDEVMALVESTEPPTRWVILNAEAITEIDTTAEAGLKLLIEELAEVDIVLALARVKAPIRDMLDRAGVTGIVGPERIYRTVEDAVAGYLAEG